MVEGNEDSLSLTRRLESEVRVNSSASPLKNENLRWFGPIPLFLCSLRSLLKPADLCCGSLFMPYSLIHLCCSLSSSLQHLERRSLTSFVLYSFSNTSLFVLSLCSLVQQSLVLFTGAVKKEFKMAYSLMVDWQVLFLSLSSWPFTFCTAVVSQDRF